MFGRKSQTEGQLKNHRKLIVLVYVNKQALLLTAAACTAEVARLKRDLGQAEEELGLVKRQLDENKGKGYPVRVSYKGKIIDANRSIINFNRGHDRSGGP